MTLGTQEGESINIDVTSPGAALALGLMFLRSGINQSFIKTRLCQQLRNTIVHASGGNAVGRTRKPLLKGKAQYS
jgi:hypothetical protein